MNRGVRGPLPESSPLRLASNEPREQYPVPYTGKLTMVRWRFYNLIMFNHYFEGQKMPITEIAEIIQDASTESLRGDIPPTGGLINLMNEAGLYWEEIVFAELERRGAWGK